MLRWLKTVVVSDEERRPLRRQAGTGKASASESLLTCRNPSIPFPWDLILKAVQAVTDLPWVVLYVRRWLGAPLALPDGTLQQRDRGTPQGSAVLPVIANLFLHFAFDAWMARKFPDVAFERHTDDVAIHCVSERQAREVLAALQERISPRRTSRGGSTRSRGVLDELLRRLLPAGTVSLLAHINAYLLRRLRKKHKRLRGRRKAQHAWNRAVRQRPRFFAHWAWFTWISAVW